MAKIEKRNYRQFFEYYIPKAGLDFSIKQMSFVFLRVAGSIAFLIYFVLLLNAYVFNALTWQYFILMTTIVFPLLFIATVILSIAAFVLFLEVSLYKRKVAIEKVLPDFLQLASANIRSGMTTDKALWGAIKPQFGVLAKEMELVAKETMSGEDLEDALESFADKYDSPTLNRTIQLIVEGIKAGGQMAEILQKISINLYDAQTLRKEMAANVTSYVMFITFAAIIAAPIMYGLSQQLITITQEVISSQDLGASASGFALSLGSGISLSDFRVFAIVNIIITGFFSAAIISTIRKGHIRSNIAQIPLFIVIGIVIYLISTFFMGKMLGGLF